MKSIADYLFETNAVRVSDPEKPFWYASGTLGPFYVNTHFLLESEAKANELLALIEEAAAGDRSDFLTTILPFVKKQYETSESYKAVIDLIVAKAKELDFDVISGGERRDYFFSLMPAYLLGKPHLSIFKDGETYFSENVEEKAVKVGEGDLSGKVSLHIADLITEASSYTNAWIPSIRGTGLSSEEFCSRLLKEKQVAAVPGTAFGPSGEGHIRCCYATAVDKINIALDRMASFIAMNS